MDDPEAMDSDPLSPQKALASYLATEIARASAPAVAKKNQPGFQDGGLRRTPPQSMIGYRCAGSRAYWLRLFCQALLVRGKVAGINHVGSRSSAQRLFLCVEKCARLACSACGVIRGKRSLGSLSPTSPNRLPGLWAQDTPADSDAQIAAHC